MVIQVLWILLALIEVVHSEQPVFVPSAAELSDVPPDNKQDWLHPVIFEPQNEIQLTCSTYQVTTFLEFGGRHSLGCFWWYQGEFCCLSI